MVLWMTWISLAAVVTADPRQERKSFELRRGVGFGSRTSSARVARRASSTPLPPPACHRQRSSRQNEFRSRARARMSPMLATAQSEYLMVRGDGFASLEMACSFASIVSIDGRADGVDVDGRKRWVVSDIPGERRVAQGM